MQRIRTEVPGTCHLRLYPQARALDIAELKVFKDDFGDFCENLTLGHYIGEVNGSFDVRHTSHGRHERWQFL